MTIFHIIIAIVVLERLVELFLSARNTRALLAEGGIETGEAHYPLFILLHCSWLIAILLSTPADASVNMMLLATFILLQSGRIWVIATLGRFWTTRIISVPDIPLIKNGPYRYFSHPNYLIVIGEIAVLPLIFGNWQVAAAWSILNALLLLWRIRIENYALQKRKYLAELL